MLCSEIIIGDVPFTNESQVTLHTKIKEVDIRPPLPSDCPKDLRFCITSCWDQNPKKQPTFVEVCKILKFAKATSLGVICGDHGHKILFSLKIQKACIFNFHFFFIIHIISSYAEIHIPYQIDCPHPCVS